GQRPSLAILTSKHSQRPLRSKLGSSSTHHMRPDMDFTIIFPTNTPDSAASVFYLLGGADEESPDTWNGRGRSSSVGPDIASVLPLPHCLQGHMLCSGADGNMGRKEGGLLQTRMERAGGHLHHQPASDARGRDAGNLHVQSSRMGRGEAR